MKPQHTPGPWKTERCERDDCWHLRGRYTFGTFSGWSADGVTTEEEDKANARLIAAAPELAGALRALVGAMQCYQISVCAKQEDAARAVLAKLEVAP